jgi:hypothetical protein
MQVPGFSTDELEDVTKAYHECHAIVTIGDTSPHSCRLLSHLAPHCPTNIPSLPETVRSGTGSVNPKPPAHGALAGSNQPWFLQGTRCDDPKTIEPVSAPNWHRFFGVLRLDESRHRKFGAPHRIYWRSGPARQHPRDARYFSGGAAPTQLSDGKRLISSWLRRPAWRQGSVPAARPGPSPAAARRSRRRPSWRSRSPAARSAPPRHATSPPSGW